jgi:ubiquinol-cytochrome c reductase cytochrome c subunit
MQPRSHEATKKTKYEGSASCFRVFVVAFVLSVVAQGVLDAVALPEAARPADGDVDRGQATFMRVGCYQCHGREAQGASTGPRLGPNPLPVPAFTRAVRTPRNEMPPYSPKILSDTELTDVYAFVASRARPHQLPK